MALDEVLQRVVVVGRDSGHVVIPEAMGALCTSATCTARCGAVSATRPARLLAHSCAHHAVVDE
ncbi:hypothetical protein F7R02_17600 [Xanthomonas cissicola]|nr:hypothetical protein F7R02_17600 [Xanthomonas cissicola]